MIRFFAGIAAGWLLYTEDGRKFAKEILQKADKDIGNLIKQALHPAGKAQAEAIDAKPADAEEPTL